GLGKMPITLVLSCSRGHDAGTLSPELWGLAGRIVVTRADPVRSWPAQTAAERIRNCYRGTLLEEPNTQRALQRAVEITPAGGVVCACGSVYMAGQARTFVQKD